MTKFVRPLLFVFVILSFVLAACGTPATPQTVTEIQTQIVNQVQVVTATPDASMAPLPPGSVQITGSGATFPLPIYTEWTYAYSYVDPAVIINYQGIGSGGGKKAIVDNTVDFAGSDSLLKQEEYDAGKDLQMYPMVASAVVPIYNIAFQNVPDGTTPAKLILDRQTLVDIFNGKLNKWNDPAIVALNPDLKDFLPNAGITVAHRSDGSGTTEIFTKALTSFSADWTAGGASAIEWPVDKAGNGVGGKGNQGVSAAVINTPNSIGYVEISFAVANGLTMADLINKSGAKVTANADSIASDMATFGPGAFDAKLTATIVDGSGAGDWPIVGYTYMILHTTSMTDCVKAEKLLDYIHWTLTDESAAARASKLGYAVLPGEVRDAVLAKLGEVTCNGSPVMMTH